MNEPQEPLNAKHIFFSLCMLTCLIVGLLSVIFALTAGAKSEFLAAGVSLIPAAFSFGFVMAACLVLIKT